ncbi:MAG: hexitol phosphatase HxpB [Thermoanaerobaculales bacterium]|jgi:sugar-phosphatase|nr:hexitol phosphatase HxpB [Thermoanaerobaculales bacterium]
MKAAIFDMDGLVIDSEPLWRRAEREVFAGVGVELTDDDCRRTTGLRADEVVWFWFQRHPWQGPNRTTVLRRLERRVRELVRAEGRAMPGVEHALAACRDGGLRLALASSSAVELIEVVLGTLGLGGVFEVVCSGADEIRGKPDPAVYLTALSKLGLPAGECLAFEDSVAGVRAARAAGCVTVAVPDRLDVENPGFDAANLKLPSLADFSLDLIGS